MKSKVLQISDDYYRNPIFSGDYPDPTVLRDGKDYYITHSSGKYRPGLLLLHSKNLVDWEPVCFAGGNIPGNIWAPDLSKYQGKYYIYFAVYFTAFSSIFVVTADSISGPWSDPIDLKIHLIDPCHCTDKEGNRYLFFSDGYMAPLSPDGLRIQGKLKKVYDGWRYPEDWHTEGLCLESPKIVKRNEYYYLTVAEGGTAGPATSHMAVSARSKSLFGPWENSPYNPIVHCAGRNEPWWNKGHATLLSDTDENWWLFYHAYEKGYLVLGRKDLLEPVEWTSDGWFRIPETVRTDEPIKRPAGARMPVHQVFSDDFTGEKPGLQWKFFEGYDESRYQFTGNGVEVSGKGELPDLSAQEDRGKLVGESNPMTCMVGYHTYEVSCAVTISGKGEGGILLFYNASFFCGFGLDETGLTFYRSGEPCGLIRLQAKQLHLKLIDDDNDVLFFYSKDGITWSKCEVSMEVSGYNHNTLGDYLSMRPGLYSIGSGSVLFQSFRCRPLL